MDAAAFLLRLRSDYRARRPCVLQLQLRCARCVQGAYRQLHSTGPGSADLHGYASDVRTTAPQTGIWEARRNWIRRMGRWWSNLNTPLPGDCYSMRILASLTTLPNLFRSDLTLSINFSG